MKGRNKIKKPKYGTIYLVCFVLILAVFLCVGKIVYDNAKNVYMIELSETGIDYYNNVMDEIEDALGEDSFTQEDVVRIKAALVNLYSLTGGRMRVSYDRHELADSSETAIVWYQDELGLSHPLELADKDYLSYFKTDEVSQYWSVETDSDEYFKGNPSLTFTCRECYINPEQTNFIPVTCEILKDDPEEGYLPTETVVQFPVDESDKEGYTLVKTDGENKMYGSVEGFDGEDNAADYTAHGSELNRYHNVYYSTRETDYDFYTFEENYGTKIKMIAGCGLAGVILLSFLPATVFYNNKKRDYEIFEYRRKLTDAMAHDLKTPMAAIISYAENMENTQEIEKQSYYVSKINEKVWQMNQMINNILEFSRSENSAADIHKGEVNLNELITGAVADNEHLISNRKLTIDHVWQDVTIPTDRDLLAQAIGNLVNNAAQYAKEGSTIRIDCDEKNIKIANEVSEEIEDVDSLRKPFVKGSESRKNYGTGLGLAIADNNLRLLKNRMDIQNKDGQFCVTVYL